MPDEFACQECGFTQDSISDGESCPFCGGGFVNLNDDLTTFDDRYGQDESDTADDDLGLSEGFPNAI